MSYDPDKQKTPDEVTEFMSKLYEALAVDTDLPALRQSLEDRGIDTKDLLRKARAILHPGDTTSEPDS